MLMSGFREKIERWNLHTYTASGNW